MDPTENPHPAPEDDAEDEPGIPEIDLRDANDPIARYVQRLRKESGGRRKALKKERAERAALEAKVAALEAAGNAPPAPPASSENGDPPSSNGG